MPRVVYHDQLAAILRPNVPSCQLNAETVSANGAGGSIIDHTKRETSQERRQGREPLFIVICRGWNHL